jgi:hypothetical protein
MAAMRSRSASTAVEVMQATGRGALVLALSIVIGCSNHQESTPSDLLAPLGKVGTWSRRAVAASSLAGRPHCESSFVTSSRRRQIDCTPGGPRPLELGPDGFDLRDPRTGAWIPLFSNGARLHIDEAFELADGSALVISDSQDEAAVGGTGGPDLASRFHGTTLAVAQRDGVARDLKLPFDTVIVQPNIWVERTAVVVSGGTLVTSKMVSPGGGCEHTAPGVGCDPAPPLFSYEQRPNTTSWALQLLP